MLDHGHLVQCFEDFLRLRRNKRCRISVVARNLPTSFIFIIEAKIVALIALDCNFNLRVESHGYIVLILANNLGLLVLCQRKFLLRHPSVALQGIKHLDLCEPCHGTRLQTAVNFTILAALLLQIKVLPDRGDVVGCSTL